MNLGRDIQGQAWRRAFSIDTGAGLALACAFLLVIASFMLKEAVFQFRGENPEWAEEDAVVGHGPLDPVVVVAIEAKIQVRERSRFPVRVHGSQIFQNFHLDQFPH